MKTKALLIALGLAASSSSSFGAAMSYNIFQDGYSEGAVMTGMFTGEDLDMDGQIVSFLGEVSDFMIEFSGNSIVPAFTANFTELFGLVWDVDSPILGDGFDGAVEGILASAGGFEYTVPNGPIPFPPAGTVTAPTGGLDETLNFVQVTPKNGVSVPSGGTTSVMLGMGVCLLGFSKRFLRR